MEKRISLERWQEAWGRPGERKLQEKDIRKKKRRGWKRRNVGLEMVKSRNRLKGKIVYFILFFIFLLYWSVGKCTFLFSVGKPIKLAPLHLWNEIFLTTPWLALVEEVLLVTVILPRENMVCGEVDDEVLLVKKKIFCN